MRFPFLYMQRSMTTNTLNSQDTRSCKELHRCEVKFLSIALKLLTSRLLIVTIALLPGIRGQWYKYLNWTKTLRCVWLGWSHITLKYLIAILIAFLRPIRYSQSNRRSAPESQPSYSQELLRVCYFLFLTLVFPRVGWLVLLFITNFELHASIPRAIPSGLEKASSVVFALVWLYQDTMQVISSTDSKKELLSFLMEYLGDSGMTGVLLLMATRGKSRLFRNRKLEIITSMLLALLVYFSLGSLLLYIGKACNKRGLNRLKGIMTQKLRVIAWLHWIKMQPGKELKYVALFLLLLPIHV